MLGDGHRVGHHAHGSCVEQHIIVFLAQVVDGLRKVLALKQLGRIGRNGACGQNVKVGADICVLHQAVEQREVIGVVRQIRGDSFFGVGQVEQGRKSRLADVKTDDDDPLAHKCNAGSKVRGDCRLSLARNRRSEEYDVLVALKDKRKVGAERTVDLHHEAVMVLLHHNRTVALGKRFHQWDGAKQRHRREARKVVLPLNAVTEELTHIVHHERNEQAHDESHEVEDFLLRRNRAIGYRLFDYLTLVGGRCEADGIFLSLLQEHEVEARLHLLLSVDVLEGALLCGSGRDACIVLGLLRLQLAALQGKLAPPASQRRSDAHHVAVELLCQRTHRRIVLGDGAEQAVALHDRLVVLGDGGRERSVGQAHVRGDDLIVVPVVVHIAGKVIDELYLRADIHNLVLITDVLRHVGGGILLVLYRPGGNLILLEFCLRGAQFPADDTETLVNEVGGTACLLHVIVVGVLIVRLGQFIDIVHAAFGYVVCKSNGCNRRQL